MRRHRFEQNVSPSVHFSSVTVSCNPLGTAVHCHRPERVSCASTVECITRRLLSEINALLAAQTTGQQADATVCGLQTYVRSTVGCGHYVGQCVNRSVCGHTRGDVMLSSSRPRWMLGMMPDTMKLLLLLLLATRLRVA
jgi:hypothetical protein